MRVLVVLLVLVAIVHAVNFKDLFKGLFNKKTKVTYPTSGCQDFDKTECKELKKLGFCDAHYGESGLTEAQVTYTCGKTCGFC